jgi:dTDP-glucose 4,6-dehydratase
MKLLITGGAGFIGSHFIDYFIKKYPKWEISVLENLNYAGSYDRLKKYQGKIKMFYHDLRAPLTDYLIKNLGELDFIFHIAADTHVDKSLVDPLPFIQSNTIGTYNVIEFARLHQPRLKMLFYISTDEVYGAAPIGVEHKEGSPHLPSNPYSASKAAAEDLIYCWDHAMGVPAIITNTMNNIGITQHPEKFIPKVIRALLNNELISIHGSPDNPGSRQYLYAGDHADAIDFLISNGRRGEKYNVVGDTEVNNLEMVMKIAEIMDKKPKLKFVDFHSTRPGHDLRYALDGSKMKELGWVPPTSFDEVLKMTVDWTLDNREWL